MTWGRKAENSIPPNLVSNSGAAQTNNVSDDHSFFHKIKTLAVSHTSNYMNCI